MADDNTIIEGTVKFRDGKKWKSRWCVMRKLSPVADCVHLQVYRDSRARWAGAASKASLSLQQYLGCEAGFTLDKHSHTLALLCRDFAAALAFETRERLMQWQVKVSGALGEGRQFLVVWGGAGPARLHLLQRRFALAAGVPPRLLGVWELAHLRRFGVVDGRFCFEGGSRCGKGEGLHVLVTDQAAEIARDFELASRGELSPRRRPLGSHSPNSNGSFKKGHMQRLELNTVERSLPPTDLRLYEGPCTGEDIGAISPYWPSAERTHFQDMGLGDTASVNEAVQGTDAGPWSGTGNAMLERCMSCISKLGALSRSSTAALTPGAQHFSPAWTMEVVDEAHGRASANDAAVGGDASRAAGTERSEEMCRCTSDRPPERPPKPARLNGSATRKPPMPLPVRSFSHSQLASIGENNSTSFGPYENYDVPKIPSAEVEGEYYDTPKRLKECLNSELFKITKNSTSNTLILKKQCGCLLTLGKKAKRPTIVDEDENFQQASCACQRVTDWAHSWIKLPYCKRNAIQADAKRPNKENVMPNTSSDASALYATVDLSRKTRRKTQIFSESGMSPDLDPGTIEVDEGPQANYENLNFALSLEHYENAKDLLRRAGVTQLELDALGANLRPATLASAARPVACAHCGHPRGADISARRKLFSDEYLLMEPNSLESNRFEQERSLPAGYTPMSPIGSFGFRTPKGPGGRPSDEKSASNPTLGGQEEGRNGGAAGERLATRDRPERRKRSSSADSSRFLDDVKEFEGGRGSASSVETLRDGDARDLDAACDCAAGKHSDADSSEASKRPGAAGRAAASAGGNRDSSSSNDSGVSSWSLRETRAAPFELPPTTTAARRRYRSARRAALSPHAPRRSRSSGGARASPPRTHKCCSAEAEVPVLAAAALRGVADAHSTSSGTSDMSDYIETLSICSSHSSSDAPITMRVLRHTTSTLRPRSGKEYRPLAPHLAARPP